MAKKLSAAVGSYTKDNQEKVRWQNIGVVLENNGKEYVLLDPTVSLAGIMALQNAEAMKKGEPLRDRIMVGLFEEDTQGQQQGYQPQQGGYQPQQQPQQNQQRQHDPRMGNGVSNQPPGNYNEPPF